MTTKISTPRPINITIGVNPVTDRTEASTVHYTYSKGVRFYQGLPKKIGGWASQSFNYGDSITGYVRSIFTEYISGKLNVMIGSNEKYYNLIGSTLTNITPLDTTSIAIANSLSTHYATLGANPIATTNGSPVVTVTDANATLLKAGDTVYLSGATAFAGLTIGDLNGDAIVRAVRVGSFDINVGNNANATTTGGGVSVIRSSGLIKVTATAHGQANGDRVKISGAANTGGVLATQINNQFIIRNVLANSFDIMTIGNATSAVTAGGGAATIYYQEIPIGQINQTVAQGYGAGLYGIGLYGTSLTSSSAISLPRIWYSDRYGNTIVTTAGNQSGVYQWMGGASIAPTLVTNAPTAVNYIFINSGILVTFGAGGIDNRIFASDQNDITQWASSSINQVFDDDIEGAGRLLSHCPANELSLIFTENETYTFRYIGLPFVWEILPLDDTVGIIAPMARVSVKGVAYWMGNENFYMYRGGKVEIVPANSQPECTALRYVFDNLNWGQKSKIFAWYNPKFDEVWFHYPDANSNEPNRVIRVNMKDKSWAIDEMNRTAAEWPSVKTVNPYLANVNTLYKHELGKDADGQPLEFILRGPKTYNGKGNVFLTGVIPDSNQTGTIAFSAYGYRYPQSSNLMYSTSYDVTPQTEFVEIQSQARYYQYQWSGNELGQDWEMGTWFDDIQGGATF